MLMIIVILRIKILLFQWRAGVGGVKERGMEVEREGGGQYQALPEGMFPTTVKVNVDREASLDV